MAAHRRSPCLWPLLLLWAVGPVPNGVVAQTAEARGLDALEVTSQRLPDVESAVQPEFVEDDLGIEEEIVVIGGPTLRDLRDELRAAQDRVHELFNALNDDDEFDIHCYMETRTGTHISRRICKANFVDAATSARGKAFLNRLRREAGGSAIPSRALIQFKNGLLREKLTTLVNENSELRDAVLRHAELSNAFDSARQKILYTNE